jgi:hypothetical protein
MEMGKVLAKKQRKTAKYPKIWHNKRWLAHI